MKNSFFLAIETPYLSVNHVGILGADLTRSECDAKVNIFIGRNGVSRLAVSMIEKLGHHRKSQKTFVNHGLNDRQIFASSGLNIRNLLGNIHLINLLLFLMKWRSINNLSWLFV